MVVMVIERCKGKIQTWGYESMNIKRVLISVSDKTGIIEFAKELAARASSL